MCDTSEYICNITCSNILDELKLLWIDHHINFNCETNRSLFIHWSEKSTERN